MYIFFCVAWEGAVTLLILLDHFLSVNQLVCINLTKEMSFLFLLLCTATLFPRLSWNGPEIALQLCYCSLYYKGRGWHRGNTFPFAFSVAVASIVVQLVRSSACQNIPIGAIRIWFTKLNDYINPFSPDIWGNTGGPYLVSPHMWALICIPLALRSYCHWQLPVTGGWSGAARIGSWSLEKPHLPFLKVQCSYHHRSHRLLCRTVWL